MNRKNAMLGAASLVVLAGLSAVGVAIAQPAAADFVIQGGMIHDGSANMKPYVGDVAISGDKIVYVGPKAPMSGRRTINARGMIVSPGFMDTHTHPDTYLGSTDPQMRQLPPWILQGVSTLVVGVDGSGVPEIGNTFARMTQQGVGTNFVALVGFGAVRQRVIGMDDRDPTPAELASEKALVAKAMCEGAAGLSSGLFYVPQSFSKTPEVVELAKEASKRGGLYDTHTRDYANFTVGYVKSFNEALQIGREANIHVHLGHIKLIGPEVWGRSVEVIKMVNDARAAGQKVTADVYPYVANGSGLTSHILPNWAYDGGYPALIRRLNDPAALEKIKAGMEVNLKRMGGPGALMFRARGPQQPWTGKYLDAVAKEWKVTPVDAAIRIMRQTESAPMVGFVMSPVDVANFTKQTWMVTSSDGGDGHPRQWGTFPTKYQEHVVKSKVISLPFFIRSSTGATADLYGLTGRGYLRQGYFADVLVFNPKTYAPKNDFTNVNVPPVGVKDLFVNGKAAVDNGKMTAVLSGRPLPRTPTPGSCS